MQTPRARELAMFRFVPALFALAACSSGATATDGGSTATGNTLEDLPEGDFVYWSAEGVDDASLSGLLLTIDVAGGTATFALGTDTQVVPLGELPQADWYEDCWLNGDAHSVNETFDLGADLALGDLVLADPLLTSKCGGRPLVLDGIAGTTWLAFDPAP